LICGDRVPEQWGQPAQPADFFDIKGDAELLLSLGAVPLNFSFRAAEHPALQKGQTAQIYRGEQPIGWIGAVHPKLSQGLDITGKVFLLELDYSALKEAQIPAVSELSRFPAVRRDLAFVVGLDVAWSDLAAGVRRAAGPVLRDLLLFDRYQGAGVESGCKSLAMGLILQDNTRTLTDQDADAVVARVVAELGSAHGARIRG